MVIFHIFQGFQDFSMFFGDSKGFLGHLRDFLDFQGSLGFSLNSQGSSDFFPRFLGWCTRFLLVIHPSEHNTVLPTGFQAKHRQISSSPGR